MKQSNPNKTQIIALCCLVLVVVAFGAYRIVGMGTQAAPVEQAVEVKEASPAVSEEVEVFEEPILIAYNAESRVRDPFSPQVPTKTSEASQQPQSTASTGPSPVVDVGPMPPFPFFGDDPPSISVTPSPPVAEADPTPDLRLTGVIEGDMNVAIIRSGSSQRYIVREGQSIEGIYTVESIARNGVRIKHNGKSFMLKMGMRQAS